MQVILDKYRFPCRNNPKCRPANWWAFLQGRYRYRAYYSKNFKWLLRKHIVEQIMWRISVMDPKCLADGACKICGCETTALQMANKACPKPCYPKMMEKRQWQDYKEHYQLNF
jgi:hypothetical protein